MNFVIWTGVVKSLLNTKMINHQTRHAKVIQSNKRLKDLRYPKILNLGLQKLVV